MKKKKINWRPSLIGIIGCLMLCAGTSSVSAKKDGPAKFSFAPDRILVSFKPGSTKSVIGAMHSNAGGQVIKKLDRVGVQVVEVPEGTVLEAIEAYKKNPNVLFAEPNYQRSLYIPATNEGSEPTLDIGNNFDEQWYLHNK